MRKHLFTQAAMHQELSKTRSRENPPPPSERCQQNGNLSHIPPLPRRIEGRAESPANSSCTTVEDVVLLHHVELLLLLQDGGQSTLFSAVWILIWSYFVVLK